MAGGSSGGTAKAHPFPGAVDRDGQVSFTLYAPGKQRVELIGEFNDWQRGADVLESIDEGLWSLTKALEPGSYGYQFVLDGDLILCDPYATALEDSPGDEPPRAIVRVSDEPYEWKHDRWDRPAYHQLRICEINVLDFSPQGDFHGLVERLDALADLHINAIELMPIFPIADQRGWGYQPIAPLAINEDCGNAREFRWLVDEAHARGIGVILDIVLSHTGGLHPFNQMYPMDQSPWYGGENQYGMPNFDYAKPATRSYARDVLRYWIEQFHVDGFRVDFCTGIGITDEGHGLPTIVQAAREVRDDIWMIAEHLPENVPLVRRAGFDGSWHIRYSYGVKTLLCQCGVGDFDEGDGGDVFERAARTMDPAAQDFGDWPGGMVNYLESHDDERVLRELQQAGFEGDVARRKAALGLTLLATGCGVPMLYHGQSWGEDTPKNMDHNPIHWDRLDDEALRGLHEHCGRALGLRAGRDSLNASNFAFDVIDARKRLIAYRRWNGDGDIVLVAANLGGEPQEIDLPNPRPGRWREFFSGDDLDLPDEAFHAALEPHAAKIFLSA